MAATRIPATVITGFLGSGKTTLIRNIIMQANGRRLALIVNEFGDIGMDGAMLEECGADSCSAEDIIELANGCICCTVADDFLPSMQQLLAQEPRPDHIIIETSGLALPQPLVQAFNWPDIKSQVMLDGVVTLVDGPALADGGVAHDLEALEAQRAADEELDHESPIDELFADQIGAANLIVLSKADVLDSDGIARARSVVEGQLTAPTPIIPVAGGAAPMDAILGLGMEDQAHERAQHMHHHHGDDHDDDHDDEYHHHHHEHGHDEFASYVIALEGVEAAQTCQTTTIIIMSMGMMNLPPMSLRLRVLRMRRHFRPALRRWPRNSVFCVPRGVCLSAARRCLSWCKLLAAGWMGISRAKQTMVADSLW